MTSVATDVRAAPAPFPPSSDEEWVLDGDAFAFAGMARAAEYVYRESYDALKALHDAGFSIVLTGHSLGGVKAEYVAWRLGLPGDRVWSFNGGAGLDRLWKQAIPGTNELRVQNDVVSYCAKGTLGHNGRTIPRRLGVSDPHSIRNFTAANDPSPAL